jgi:hypothetical protein
MDSIKKIIRESLVLLEMGRLARHNGVGSSTYTPRGDNRITKNKMETIMNMVNEKAEQYSVNKELYGSTDEGDGIYQVILGLSGLFKTTLTSLGAEKVPGTSIERGDLLIMYVKAYTRVQHPDQPDRTNDSVGISPADDAQVKVSFLFNDVIEDFLNKHTIGIDNYNDGSGVDIANNKMSDRDRVRKAKKDLEIKLNRKIKDTELNDYLENGVEPKPSINHIDNDILKDVEIRIKELQGEKRELRRVRMQKSEKDIRKNEIDTKISELRELITKQNR